MVAATVVIEVVAILSTRYNYRKPPPILCGNYPHGTHVVVPITLSDIRTPLALQLYYYYSYCMHNIFNKRYPPIIMLYYSTKNVFFRQSFLLQSMSLYIYRRAWRHVQLDMHLAMDASSCYEYTAVPHGQKKSLYTTGHDCRPGHVHAHIISIMTYQ